MSTWFAWEKGFGYEDVITKEMEEKLVKDKKIIEFEDEMDNVFFDVKSVRDTEKYDVISRMSRYPEFEVYEDEFLKILGKEIVVHTEEITKLDDEWFKDETIEVCKNLKCLIDNAIKDDEAIYRTL